MAPSVDAKNAAGDITGQENVAPKNQPARQPSKQQVRHRASVACASCRDRRIRCVVPKDQTTCTACQKTGAECIIKNDDERRRPISKAYMSSLSDRISMLEGMLLEQGVVPPPASHPPKSRHEPLGGQQEDIAPAASHQSSLPKPERASPGHSAPSPPDSRTGDYMAAGSEHDDGNLSGSQLLQPLIKEESPIRILDPKQEDIIHRLLSTKGNLSFDQISGRLRFFGPTANSHVYAESPDQYDTRSREPPGQVRQAEGIIRSLDPETHDYLVDHFFQYYNSAIQIIDREAFEADRQSQYPRFYSHFLHVTILAMGYRSADMDREDMQRITLRRRESTLHREAKAMLDSELERPGGIPSVQALLLLGDLECGVGRDNTGWMYSGMANRLAFDIGLHLDCRNNMSEQDTKIRNMVMQACVIYDRYWGLFLGRPLAIKSQDVDLLSNRFSQLISIGLDPPKQDPITEIYEQLIELMELAGRIVEIRDLTGSSRGSSQYNALSAGEAEESRYLQVVNLDRQLQNWYRRLPERLSWKPSNLKTAPYSFFLLHQQYHVTMILLHQPWAKYGSITGDGASTGSHSSPKSDHTASTDDFGHRLGSIVADGSLGMGCPQRLGQENRTSLSRSICTQQAIRVARIFWQHRQRFDGRKIFVTGMQHAGSAAIALIAALAYQRNEPDRRTYVGYLEILSDAVGDMSHTYHPASRMDDLLKAVLDQIRNSMAEQDQSLRDSTSCKSAGSFPDSSTSGLSVHSDLPSSTIPLRREATDPELGKPVKKRRPASSRQSSGHAPSQPPYFAVPTQPPPLNPDKAQHLSYSSSQQSQSQFNPLLFSMGMNDPSGQLDLGFVGGAAIDMDPNGDGSGGLLGRPEAMDLGIPSSGGWNLSTMQHSQGLFSYDTPIDWTSGTAGLSASSVLNQSAAISSGIMSGIPTFASSKDGGKPANDRKPMGGIDTKLSAMDSSWMSGRMGSVSPAGLGSMAHNANKTSQGDDGSQRNHSLDFFSF